MNLIKLLCTLFLLFSLTTSAQAHNEAETSTPIAKANKLACEKVFDLREHTGITFLSYMQKVVKPEIDRLVDEGYPLAGKAQVAHTLKNVSRKVRSQALRATGGESKLLSLADKLEGKMSTLHELPGLIAKTSRVKDRYKLSTFIGLASCAGVVLKLHEGNYAYNIHYGSGSDKNDKKTGRSFGEGPHRDADDASDKNYLRDLQEYVTNKDSKIEKFYKTLIEALTNSDTSKLLEISPFGQTLLTDFLAVYTAEQARNLMDNRIELHWDAALLEVTLLGAFHVGQEKVEMFFFDPNLRKTVFTDQVVNQAPGGSDRKKERKARLYDYWQFSKSTKPEYRNRSGINITKKEFRKLGELVSDHMRKNHVELVGNIERHFETKNRGKNIFRHLSEFLINKNTKEQLGLVASQLAEDYTLFLMKVKEEAKVITQNIKKIKYYQRKK